MIPEWIGWIVLGSLVAAFATATWWLLLSPLPRATAPKRDTPSVRRTQLNVATLVLVSGALFSAGARWDELWHRMYGGFGDDFLWPPHILLYGGLAMNVGFAAWGLSRTLSGRGSVRQRFRAQPLIGLLGLVAAYQIASIPSDVIWHIIIGPDLTAWSLPHVVLALTTSTIWLAGIALAISSRGGLGVWRVLGRLGRAHLIVIGLAALCELALLQIGVTEWEWLGDAGSLAVAAQRPAWAYLAIALAVGIGCSSIALYATRRIGAATCTALLALGVQVLTAWIDGMILGEGPILSSYLLVLCVAVVADAVHGLWLYGRVSMNPTSRHSTPIS